MYGDRRPYPVAMITLDPEEIVPWAQEQGLPEDLAELAEHETVIEMIQVELDRANSNYARVEQIKRFAILDHDLSIETGELTPSLKVKRNVIYERYGDVFDSLYLPSLPVCALRPQRAASSNSQKSRPITCTETLRTGTSPIAPANVPAWAWPCRTRSGPCSAIGAASRSVPRNAQIPSGSPAIVAAVGA